MKKFLKRILAVVIIIALIIVSIVLSLGFAKYKDVTSNVSISEKVKSIRDNKNFVPLEDVNKYFTEGIVSIEDHRFYKHQGLDYISIARAFYNAIKAGEVVEGGSTITQQVAKNMYFDNSPSLERKGAEIFISRALEKSYTKDEILELYINIIYFGHGNYGIKKASKDYFNKSPKDLTFDEATILAGLPQAPSTYTAGKDFENARKRQKYVIKAMEESGYETEKIGEEIK